MKILLSRSLFSSYAVSAILALVSGCASLLPPPIPPPTLYSLDGGGTEIKSAPRELSTDMRPKPTLLVSTPHAAAGFDSQRIIYFREPHKLEYFAHSEWVDTPARMLSTLILNALDTYSVFQAVLPSSSAAGGELRLDTELVRLQQNFDSQPSRVRFTLRVSLLDGATRAVIASREFDETVAAPSDDPYGGVVAANRAVQIVLVQVANFCADVATKRLPPR
jgi:cholesterol transport system auxiliary component